MASNREYQKQVHREQNRTKNELKRAVAVGGPGEDDRVEANLVGDAEVVSLRIADDPLVS